MARELSLMLPSLSGTEHNGKGRRVNSEGTRYTSVMGEEGLFCPGQFGSFDKASACGLESPGSILLNGTCLDCGLNSQ